MKPLTNPPCQLNQQQISAACFRFITAAVAATLSFHLWRSEWMKRLT
jgi:hypothetical protein